MKRILLLAILSSAFFSSKSQNLSYSCPRDTVLGCNSSCFTLKAQFPDVRAVGNDYTLQNITTQAACRPYVIPGAPGPSTGLSADDTYSSIIPIGFNFPFYGTNRSSLVVSTNGEICFDLTNAGRQSIDYGILNDGGALNAFDGTPQNLPSALYEKAIIMGPYHDIEPGTVTITNSPSQSIRYYVVGTAPNRKWVLSFYKIPLFDCNDLIQNTHQIVLHESTGIIEVQIIDKEICDTWNEGRAMIGLQDDTRTKAIMAPGRRASDDPWGSVGMNEVWRFIPKGGAPLYRSVELLDAAGTVVATGDTTRVDVNTFETSFPSVCPPAGNSLYVVKTTYQRLDDPTSTIYSLDTINVVRQSALPLSATMTPTTCGNSTGTITATAAGTPDYQYSVDGGVLQASNVFPGLAVGPHTIYAIDATGCNNTITIEVTSISELPSTVTHTNVSCTGVNNGSITVTPTAGVAPYTYSIDGGVTTQPTGVFPNLSPGIYTITFVDANLCSGTTVATTIPVGTDLTGNGAHTNTTCNGANDGTITITPDVAGSYTFSISPGTTTNTTGIFPALAPNTYSVTFTNTVTGCSGTVSGISITVGGTISSSWHHDDETCPGANDGVITITPAVPASYSYVLTPGGITNTTGIFPGLSPNVFYSVTYTNTVTGCSGTKSTMFVLPAATISGTAAHTDVSCTGLNDGTITISPLPAAGTYTYTITPAPVSGPATNTTGIFTNLAPNTYSVSFTNAGGCGSTVSNIIVNLGPAGLTASTPVPVATSCQGANNGSVTINPIVAGAYSFTITPAPVSGPATNTTGIFTNLAAATYSVTFSNTAGCSGTVSNIIVNSGSGLTASTPAPVATSCQGANNGSVTINPTVADAYNFTITPAPVSGSATNTTGVFTNLAAATYSVTFSNAAGCSGTVSNIIVNSGSGLTASTPAPVATSCQGANNGSVTINPTVADAYNFTITPAPVSGSATNTTGVFTNLAAATYSVTFSNAAGCSGTVSNIIVNSGSGLTASTPAPIGTSCAGAPDGSITITPTVPGAYSFTITPAPVSGPATNNTGAFTNLAAATYSVVFTNTTGCSGTVNNIVVNPGPSLAANPPSLAATSCQGASDGTITITPTIPGTYTFTITPAPVSGPATNTTGIFTNLAAATYSVTFTNTSGCSGTVNNIVVNPGPSPAANPSSVATSCQGASDGTITITTIIPGAYTFTITPAPVSGSATNNTGVFTNLAAATYSVTFSNSAGCSTTINNINVNPGSALMATASPIATSCSGVNDGSITVTPTIAGAYTFTITPAPVTGPASNTTGIFTNLLATTYSVSFSNSAGCSKIITDIVVNPGAAPTGNAVSTPTSCPSVNDGTITITPTPSGTGGPYSFTITGPSGTFTQAGAAATTFVNLMPGIYSASFTSASSGCIGTITPAPSVGTGPYLASTFTPSNPPCANNNDGSIAITPDPSSAPPYDVILTGPGGPYNQTSATPVFINLAPGTYNYSFTDANGCTGNGVPIALTTHSPLATTITTVMPLCNGNSDGIITLSASGGVAPYTYGLSSATGSSSGTFSGIAAGTYTFRIKDAVGCIKDTTVTLAQPALLAANASSSQGTCNGNDGSIHVNGNGGTPAYTYSIDNGLTYQSSPDFIVSGGSYPNISVKDSKGCIANTAVNVTLVDDMSPLVIGNDTTICAEQFVTFQPQVSTQASVFNWTTIPDPSLVNTLDNDTIKNATASPLDTTTYVLNAHWGVCSRIDTITINVLHKPVPYAGKDTAVCYDNTIAVLHGSATNLSGTVNYSWSDTTNLQTPHDAVTVATPPVTETFLLTVTDNYGCNFSVTDDITVKVQPPVPAFAGNDTIAVLGQPHQLSASGGVAYAWSPAAPLNFSNIGNPLATLDHDQLFVVTVTDEAGCVGSDNIFVQVYEGPAYHVPNAFSPNGDGLNDVFRVVPPGISYTEWFRVFNRYGDLMFETNQWLKGWDGTYRGKKQPVGNYVWVIKGVNKFGRVVEMKGTVMLVQ